MLAAESVRGHYKIIHAWKFGQKPFFFLSLNAEDSFVVSLKLLLPLEIRVLVPGPKQSFCTVSFGLDIFLPSIILFPFFHLMSSINAWKSFCQRFCHSYEFRCTQFSAIISFSVKRKDMDSPPQ